MRGSPERPGAWCPWESAALEGTCEFALAPGTNKTLRSRGHGGRFNRARCRGAGAVRCGLPVLVHGLDAGRLAVL